MENIVRIWRKGVYISLPIMWAVYSYIILTDGSVREDTWWSLLYALLGALIGAIVWPIWALLLVVLVALIAIYPLINLL